MIVKCRNLRSRQIHHLTRVGKGQRRVNFDNLSPLDIHPNLNTIETKAAHG
nr:MAG TPA: hypothetical protein [Caudoviricetes sp.]